MTIPLNVLILEDRTEDAELVLYELRQAGFDTRWKRVETEAEYLAQLHPDLDIILSDFSMPQFSAPQALALLQESGLDIPFIIITGTISEEVAVESIKRGAADYLLKDRLSRLGQAVSQALERKRARIENSRAEKALRRRDRIMEAVGFAASRFLTTPDWEQSINEVIEQLGQATEVSRVYLFENHFGEDGSRLVSQRYEWVASGISPQINNPQLQAFPIYTGGFADWAEALSRGVPINGLVKDLHVSGRKFLEEQDICSILLAPIFVGQEWWGLLGFDECFNEREWYAAEIDAVKIAGSTLGAAIQRKRIEEALQKSEEQLQQSQKMEAIGTLAGGIAHDFNNLLTAILGNTQLAFRQLHPDDPLKLRLLEVERAGTRATSLTRQLLAFSRRQRLERRTINLNDTIGETMRLLQRIIGEDIAVRVKAAPNLSAVYADPAQIEQVVMNLGVNARDAMPQGGQLTFETSNVELDESYRRKYPYIQPGKYVEIRVSDSGIGMDEETQGRIFEPFFTTKEIGKGTGLGLAMVYGIIKQHEGHINVYSEVGHGTTFEIFLPAVESDVEKEAQAVQLPLLGGTETILVAEDEEALRNLAKNVLEGLGYTVLLAENGEQAVEIYTKNREQIGLLLFDVVMPRIGGWEAYERIRELGGDVPLIFMTGYSSETVQSRFVKQNKSIEELGAVVLQKPYNIEGLGRKIREVLDAASRKQ
jgi:signal transduction histidine kinase/DNA-binding response OmpR family regulator